MPIIGIMLDPISIIIGWVITEILSFLKYRLLAYKKNIAHTRILERYFCVSFAQCLSKIL